jgi:hypothetical protein
VKLEHLFDGELRYEESNHTATAPYGDGRWFGYTPAHGSVHGRLEGTVRCHNLYEQQVAGPELFRPVYRGAIDTIDGGLILFQAEGLNRFVDDTHGVAVMSMTFRSSDERYRWLNEVVAVVEALCFAVVDRPDTERWELRAFECLNELAY